MPVKIRLSRHGRKRKPYFHIIVADSRAPRDGKLIEKIGFYNPTTNPATIELDFDKALDWVQKGAQPTDTCRAILSYKGVMYKKHLLEGVKKNAFSEDEAEKRFDEWMKEKEARIEAKRDAVSKSKEDLKKEILEKERKIKEARAEELAKQNSELVDAEAESEEETVSGEVKEEPKAEEKPAEEPKEEPKAEEKPAEEPKEEPKAEEKPAEEPKEEPKAEEKPAEDVNEETKKEETPPEAKKEEAKTEASTENAKSDDSEKDKKETEG